MGVVGVECGFAVFVEGYGFCFYLFVVGAVVDDNRLYFWVSAVVLIHRGALCRFV